jgi:nitroimidazol reductase NimA-like FMN-containing flavoprotein (pyridoxamine 5'-phosphate oxidase superfamily)
MKIKMKKVFEIKDKTIINEVFNNAEYGTLAICDNNKPYSLPINYVELNNEIYFHGSKKGRKIDILKNNQLASFSVVESYSMIQSYFSSNDELACPATQFFKSIIIDGEIKFVEKYDEKVKVLSELMKKLQKEGKYKPLSEEVYQKTINATKIYKLIPNEIKAKFKFGQHLNQERFDMIIKHLEERGNEKDILTIKLMKKLKV